MARKHSNPALYELIRSRATPPPAPVEPSEPEPSAVRHLPRWLSPGRTIRLPVGYLLLAAGVVVALVVAGYMLGYRRAERTVQAGFDESLLAAVRRSEQAVRTRDPLLAGPFAEAPGTEAAVAPPAQAPLAQRSPEPPIFSDPRQPGLSYFVLAETVATGAERLARYCRERGLEAYVVGKEKSRFRRVIALPGFDPADRSSPEVKALEARIRSIGDTWKDQEQGATDLRDTYPSLFRG